jgi:hypothetical protein
MDSTVQWRPIPGFPNYQVSSLGQVWSRARAMSRGGILAGGFDDAGYPKVTLMGGGQQATRTTHSLVALAFLGPKPDGLEVRHLDGNYGNPALTNLVYGTKSENALDAVAHGTNFNRNKDRCPQGHPYDEENTYVPPSKPRSRLCRACKSTRAARYRRRLAA